MTNHETEPYTPYEPEQAYEWDYGDAPQKGPNILWGRIVALGVGLLLVFFLGRATAPEGVPESRVRNLESDLASAEDQVETLQAQVEALQEVQTEDAPEATPTLPSVEDEDTATDEEFTGKTYVVQSGDNLRNIAQRFCKDPVEADYIAEFNGLDDPSLISPGTELMIPEDCGQ